MGRIFRWPASETLGGGRILLTWLDDHATVVQAGTAVVQALATIVLVWVTHRYVRLTKRLAEAATAEVERQREATVGRRLQFVATGARLEVLLAELPEDRNEERLRLATLWNDGEVEEFVRLAARLGKPTMTDATTAALSLRWLAKQTRYVQGTRTGEEVEWDRLPENLWKDHLTVARGCLRSIGKREVAGDLVGSS